MVPTRGQGAPCEYCLPAYPVDIEIEVRGVVKASHRGEEVGIGFVQDVSASPFDLIGLHPRLEGKASRDIQTRITAPIDVIVASVEIERFPYLPGDSIIGLHPPLGGTVVGVYGRIHDLWSGP